MMTPEQRATLERAAEILRDNAMMHVRAHEASREDGDKSHFRLYCDALDAHLSIRRVLLEPAPCLTPSS